MRCRRTTAPSLAPRRALLSLSSLCAVAWIALGCGGPVTGEDAGSGVDAGPVDAGGCAAGELGCACGAGGACAGDLRCDEGRCAACPVGEDGCPCDGGACDAGLECMGERCAPPTCSLGAEGCPCDGGACGEGLACMSGMCEACSADMEGCPCAGGACGAGLVCDPLAAACRAPRECADLVAMDLCGEHQRCEPGAPGTDASCGEGCEAGFRWSTAGGACVACVSPDCAAEPSCDPEAAGSIAAECAAEHRGCEVDEDGIGACAACEPGYAEIGGECRVGLDCGGVVCGADQYCDAGAPGGPACAPRPCADPMRATPPGTTSCTITCTIDCRVEGSTGRVWPFADADTGHCVCETLPGYYWQRGGEAVPIACDADGDGWVRDAVGRPPISGAGAAPALAANMRCTIRSADRVELQNDLGQSLVVRSCEEGLLTDPAAECAPYPLRLLESERNDVPGRPELDDRSGPYVSGGRAFAAEELNALTKACANDRYDYDDDGDADIGQSQPTPSSTSSTDFGEGPRMRALAHFVELHTVHYVPPPTGAGPGTLVIAERSRCSPDFPVTYDDSAGFDPDDGSTYWRSCERRRDPAFDAGERDPGFDFAQFSCDARLGTCPRLSMPAHPTLAGMPDPDDALLRGHGACELGGVPPADGAWRGMSHHSQFRCVRARGVVLDPAYDVDISRFGASGDLAFVACTVEPGSTTRPHGSGEDPHIGCMPASVRDGDVGWAAVRYRPYGHRRGATPEGEEVGVQSYRGGCVNEDAEWPALCPAPEFERCETPPTDAFGRYRCHGQESSFLWAGDGETEADYRRSSLVMAAEDPAVAPNMSVWDGDSSVCM